MEHALIVTRPAHNPSSQFATSLAAVAMNLAGRAGINVARSELTHAAGRDVLLVERFDRTPDGGRLMVVSAVTILGLDPLPRSPIRHVPRTR
jgi:hypothetical protein